MLLNTRLNNSGKINIVLFYCGLRTGHFGQGTFINSLMPFFLKQDDISVTIIETDCDGISGIAHNISDNIETISIPRLLPNALISCDNTPFQKDYANNVIGNIYLFLANKGNLVFWLNSIDYLNIALELKTAFAKSKLVYVHHSFSWKYFVNVPDNVFAKEWRRGNVDYHPKAFELTQYQQKMAEISDQTVTVTDHAKFFFNKVLNIPLSKLTRIYNGGYAPTEINEFNKSNLRLKYGFSKNENIILFTGRIVEDKGYLYLLKAFKLLADKCPNSSLVIIGSGNTFKYVNLVNPHFAKVVYTGELCKDEVMDFYTIANIGVLPSLHEQCSFTAIEMCLHKLPLIVSAVDGLDEMFNDNVDALKISVDLNLKGEKVLDVNQLAGYIERLLYDKELSSRLANNSFDKGLKLFNAEKTQKLYYNLIKQLAYID